MCVCWRRMQVDGQLPGELGRLVMVGVRVHGSLSLRSDEPRLPVRQAL